MKTEPNTQPAKSKPTEEEMCRFSVDYLYAMIRYLPLDRVLEIARERK